MLLLSTLLIVLGIVGVLAGAVRLWSRGPKWWWACAGLVAGSAGLAAGRWSPVSNVGEPFEVIGAGVMLCAVVVLIRMWVMAWRRRARWRGLGSAVAASIGVVAFGWGVSVWWPAKEYGWWLALPRAVRIEAVPWLPEAGIASIWPEVRPGESEPRAPLWAWEAARLESRLVRLVRERRDLESLELYGRCGEGARAYQELAGLVFLRLLDRFVDGPEVAESRVAYELYSFTWSGRAWRRGLWAPNMEEVPAAALARLPRLVEKTSSPDERTASTAFSLISIFGDEAIVAIEPLFAAASRPGSTYEQVQSAAESTLSELCRKSDRVREPVLERLQSPDRATRLLAVRCLRQWNWQDDAVMRALTGLAAHADPETAQAAAEALPYTPPPEE
jgi:hypothetical protein